MKILYFKTLMYIVCTVEFYAGMDVAILLSFHSVTYDSCNKLHNF